MGFSILRKMDNNPLEPIGNKERCLWLSFSLPIKRIIIECLTKYYVGSTINNIIGGTTNAKSTKNHTHF